MNSSFDAAYYARLAEGVSSVLRDAAPALSSEQADLLAELVGANEPGVALEILGEILGEAGHQIPRATAQAAVDLATEMGLVESAQRFTLLCRGPADSAG